MILVMKKARQDLLHVDLSDRADAIRVDRETGDETGCHGTWPFATSQGYIPVDVGKSNEEERRADCCHLWSGGVATKRTDNLMSPCHNMP